MGYLLGTMVKIFVNVMFSLIILQRFVGRKEHVQDIIFHLPQSNVYHTNEVMKKF